MIIAVVSVKTCGALSVNGLPSSANNRTELFVRTSTTPLFLIFILNQCLRRRREKQTENGETDGAGGRARQGHRYYRIACHRQRQKTTGRKSAWRNDAIFANIDSEKHRTMALFSVFNTLLSIAAIVRVSAPLEPSVVAAIFFFFFFFFFINFFFFFHKCKLNAL